MNPTVHIGCLIIQHALPALVSTTDLSGKWDGLRFSPGQTCFGCNPCLSDLANWCCSAHIRISLSLAMSLNLWRNHRWHACTCLVTSVLGCTRLLHKFYNVIISADMCKILWCDGNRLRGATGVEVEVWRVRVQRKSLV